MEAGIEVIGPKPPGAGMELDALAAATGVSPVAILDSAVFDVTIHE